jgi:hypothetical protein
MPRYATGSRVWAICDRCGLRGYHNDMVSEPQTRLRVHDACLDEPRPKPRTRPDAVVLRHPRPDKPED